MLFPAHREGSPWSGPFPRESSISGSGEAGHRAAQGEGRLPYRETISGSRWSREGNRVPVGVGHVGDSSPHGISVGSHRMTQPCSSKVLDVVVDVLDVDEHLEPNAVADG